MSAKILVYNFVAGLFGTKGGFIFQGLNVSCETSVCCVTCDCSLYASAFSLSASKRVSLAEIVRLNLTQTQCRCFFLSIFFSNLGSVRTVCICVLPLVICFFYIWEGNMQQWILKGGRQGREEKEWMKMDVCEKTSKLAIMSAVNAPQDKIGGIFSWSGIFTTREGEKNR